jgi:hypothetical protein
MSVSAIKAGLRAYLATQAPVVAQVGDRIYPMAFPENGTWPAVVYSVADTDIEYDVAGTSRIRQIEMELLSASTDSDTPDDVADVLEAALVRGFGPNFGGSGIRVEYGQLAAQQARVDEYEPVKRLYGVRQRFVLWIS